MKLAAQYLRMSTVGQRFSLESQAALIKEFAAREGFEIVRSYEDAGRSGLTTNRREGLKSLLRDVVHGTPFSAILVADVSRWGRYQDPDEAGHYEFLCREAGVAVHYCAEGFDDNGSPTAALLKSMKRMMAAEYSRQLSEKVRAGLRRTLLAGRRTGGSTPFGFARQTFNVATGGDARLLKPGERASGAGYGVRLIWGADTETSAVRRIFRMFVTDGHGTPEIARILNREGVAWKGQLWSAARVLAVLNNELVTGVFAYNRSEWRVGACTRQADPARWSRMRVLPAMVPKSTYARAQARLAAADNMRLDDVELIADLRSLLASEGLLSRAVLIASPTTASFATYQKRFGSIQAAFRLAGYERTTRTRDHVEQSALEPEAVKAGLARLLAEKGYLSAALINQTGYLPHATTLRSRYGSLESLYRAAGYHATRSEMLVAAWERRAQDGARPTAERPSAP